MKSSNENNDEIIQLSSEDENAADDKTKVVKKAKKKLKVLRKDQRQPKIQNYFEIKNQNYFATFKQAQLPAQVSFMMLAII